MSPHRGAGDRNLSQNAIRSACRDASRRSLAATIGWVTVGALCAQAADRPATHDTPTPAFGWAGLHIGLNAGVGFPIASGGKLEALGGFPGSALFDLTAPNRDVLGPSLGAQVGYDWQVGHWVYGVETELNSLGVRSPSTGLFAAPASLAPAIVAYDLTSGDDGNYFASVRARLGFAVDRSLFYATGGVATGGERGASSLFFFGPSPGAPFYAPPSRSSRMKYVVGAGVDYALYTQWSARLEYLYLNQELQTRVYGDGIAAQYGARQRSEAHVLRLGLNYRFGVAQDARGGIGADQNENDKNENDKGESNKSESLKDIGDHLYLTGDGGAPEAAPAQKNEAAKTASGKREAGDDKGKVRKGATKEEKKDDTKSDELKNEESKPELYSVHGQITNILQGYPKFPAFYKGQNSFPANGQARFGSTANLFLGVHLWEGAAVYLNPEIDVGYGLANSVGAASYVNGAVAKVGRAAPYMRFQRYFLRQIIGLGGGTADDPDTGSFSETLESTQNQLAGKVDRDRLTLTVGKFAVGDVFDDNVYAHDPTTGFLNFAFNSMGTFDYAADAWGYTHGVALEWKQDWWTARGGLFQLSSIPNSAYIEPVLGRQFMSVGEFEMRYDLAEQLGVLKFLIYGDNGYLNKVDEVVDVSLLTGQFPPDITNNALRKRRVKLGGHINLQQQIAPNLGFFLRAGISNGRFETVDYTDIDRQVSFGLVTAGKLWDRPKDEIGAAMAFSGLAGSRVRYFAFGGTSVYIGDGALSYGGEKVIEAYYKLNLIDGVDLTVDYQIIGNPGHNLDRGPVNVFGLRMHAQF
ncbi:hypothetical protein MSC49_41320 (plasmid) [Methylosinus sp. C49]|uniref:carbohydrate porin n=1 Tax=Methylosinus sporium TaxID=428 RepID=UPI0013679135|nr:carbohydrate porin [Methylosinus sporium]BBU64197.1 hypothetical protein MSC49_41320 [Methylosinus sp. C49]